MSLSDDHVFNDGVILKGKHVEFVNDVKDVHDEVLVLIVRDRIVKDNRTNNNNNDNDINIVNPDSVVDNDERIIIDVFFGDNNSINSIDVVGARN